jgi:serine/threonine-protein kinase
MEPDPGVPLTVRALLGVVGYDVDPRQNLHDFFLRLRGTLRARSFLAQLETEIAAYRHEVPEALAAIARGVDDALYDLDWMDRCPLLAELRGEAQFGALRAKVAERAAAVERAYRESP